MYIVKIMVITSQPSLKAEVRQVLNRLEKVEVIDCEQLDEANELVTQIRIHLPDMVLLDIELQSLKGLELTDRIVREHPSIPVIAVNPSPEENDDLLLDVIQCGASAYVTLSGDSGTSLPETIEDICRGELPINKIIFRKPRIAQAISGRFQEMALAWKKGFSMVNPLTAEETEILDLIARQNSRKQIEEILGIAEHIIDVRVRGILQKLSENARAYRIFTKVRKDMLSVLIARHGNLFLFDARPVPCGFQPPSSGFRSA